MIKIKPSIRKPGKVHSEEEAETTSDEEADKKEEKEGAEIDQKESNGPFVVDDIKGNDKEPTKPAGNKEKKNTFERFDRRSAAGHWYCFALLFVSIF